MHRILLLAVTSTFFSAQAAEHTVTPQPFHTEATLNAVFLPAKSTAIAIQPEVWTDFTITSFASQGASVKKGDTLIGIETKHLDKHIAALEKARAVAALTLAAAKHDLAQLELSTPRNLENHARTAKQTAEDLEWYTQIGHAKETEETKRSVKTAQMRLEYQKEELKQLLKMYGEDNKTEETEEIILKRTRNYVDQAKFALESAEIEAKRTLTTDIPRKLKNMKLAAETARITNESAQQKLPRALEQKRLEVAKAERDHQENAEKLAQIKADRNLMNITAPTDGIVYYGSMENGRWNPAAAAKLIKIGGKLPANTTLMTIIPQNTPLTLHAFAAETDLASLKTGAKGFATNNLNRYAPIPVTISQLATHPETDGSYRVILKPTLAQDTPIVPGMKASAKIQGHKTDTALTIPTDFITHQADGSYTVKLKLADGKTEDRPITIGASNKTKAVITKGLEKGQVIVK